MIDKSVSSLADSVADIFDGATVMVGGFGEAIANVQSYDLFPVHVIPP